MHKLMALIQALRPFQWIKNLSLFAAVLFSGQLFEPTAFWEVAFAASVFSLLSSAIYLLNDVVDKEHDQSHPFKKHRPVASGALEEEEALVFSTLLAFAGVFLAYHYFNQFFLLLSLVFLGLEISYSLFFRNIIIMDGMAVAGAFVIRVFAGAWAVPTPISSWLILSTIGLALLLSFGKRRSEKTILSAKHLKFLTRDVLKHYPDSLLDAIISMSSSFAVLSYAIFAFQTSPTTNLAFGFIPPTLATPKWMMLTIPLVIYGVARYLYVIYEKKEGESPEKVLIGDLPLLGTAIAWGGVIIWIVYFL